MEDNNTPRKIARRIESHLRGKGTARVTPDGEIHVRYRKLVDQIYTPGTAAEIAHLLFSAYMNGYEDGKEAGMLDERIRQKTQ